MIIIPPVKEFTGFMIGNKTFLKKEEAEQEALRLALQESLDDCVYEDGGFDLNNFEAKMESDKQFREAFLAYCNSIVFL